MSAGTVGRPRPWRKLETTTCAVAGCKRTLLVAIAGDGYETTFLCVDHAVAWSESTLCRELAQRNESVSPEDLATWLDAMQVVAS